MPSWWTEERIQELTSLWGSGVSVVDIAAQLQCSRNAIIGKADRLGLPQHANYKRLQEQAPERSKIGNRKPRSKPHDEHCKPRSKPHDQHRAITLMDLTAGMCHFPIDHDCYCGAQTDGGSYCDKHHRITYIAKRPAKARAIRLRISNLEEEINVCRSSISSTK
jgi:GcrA cell cycle regulator